jgi:hypothetical protein
MTLSEITIIQWVCFYTFLWVILLIILYFKALLHYKCDGFKDLFTKIKGYFK